MKVIVIPTYKEKHTLTQNLRKINNLLTNNDMILLIDDSKDFETEQFKNLAYRKKSFPIMDKKRGYGKSLKLGLMIATYILEAEYIIQMDADHNPEDLKLFFRNISDKTDFIIGYEPKKKRRLKRFVTRWLSRRIGLDFKQPTCGFKLYKNHVLKNLEWKKIKSSGFDIQIEILFQLHQKRFRSLQIPISDNKREYDKSKMGLRQIWKHLLMYRRLFTKHLYISFINLFSGDKQHE